MHGVDNRVEFRSRRKMRRLGEPWTHESGIRSNRSSERIAGQSKYCPMAEVPFRTHRAPIVDEAPQCRQAWVTPLSGVRARVSAPRVLPVRIREKPERANPTGTAGRYFGLRRSTLALARTGPGRHWHCAAIDMKPVRGNLCPGDPVAACVRRLEFRVLPGAGDSARFGDRLDRDGARDAPALRGASIP